MTDDGFDILTEIVGVEIIAISSSIRDLQRLRRAELHWYEAHGIGKKDFKIKRYVE